VLRNAQAGARRHDPAVIARPQPQTVVAKSAVAATPVGYQYLLSPYTEQQESCLSVRRNEVNKLASVDRSAGKIDRGLYIEEHRQQRAGLLLKNVAYLLHAEFEVVDGSLPTILKNRIL